MQVTHCERCCQGVLRRACGRFLIRYIRPVLLRLSSFCGAQMAPMNVQKCPKTPFLTTLLNKWCIKQKPCNSLLLQGFRWWLPATPRLRRTGRPNLPRGPLRENQPDFVPIHTGTSPDKLYRDFQYSVPYWLSISYGLRWPKSDRCYISLLILCSTDI